MKFLAMTTAVLALTATAALANPNPAATSHPSSKTAATALATEAPLILARRGHYRYYGARRCLERLGYGRTGSYGCG